MKNGPEQTKDGFTPNEQEAWEALGKAVMHFRRLKMSHPSHEQDFCAGIHAAQNVLAQRILQREHPELFAVYIKVPRNSVESAQTWKQIKTVQGTEARLMDNSVAPNPLSEE